MLISNKGVTKEFMQRCFRQQPIFGPVLEIGSGRDRFNRELFSRRYKVIATNIYPKNLVDYICSVNCLPFEDGRFGGVICEHVLEHVEEPAKAIAEISRVLRPGGLLILIVPFAWPLHDKPYDLWRFTEEGLRALLMKRFEQVKFETIGKPDKTNLICVTARKPVYKKQEKKTPRVSVIMPTYNRAHMIGKSIDSVLHQTFTDWELIVVSDGSTDNTRQVVRKYRDPRIIFLEKKNAGPASARNYGLRHARGEYIAYCDDDDEIFPYHLQTMVNYLDRHPEVELVRGNCVSRKENETRGYSKIGFLWATMHRRKHLKRIGRFDEKLFTGEDIEFILRFSDYYPTKYLKTIMTRHLMHEKSIIAANKSQLRKDIDMIYTKRVRVICKNQKIGEKYFLMLAYFLMELSTFKAVLALAKFFQKQYACPEASYLLGWAHYRLGNLSEAINALKKVLQYKNKSYKRSIVPRQILKECTYVFLAKLYTRRFNKTTQGLKYLNLGIRKYPRSHMLKVETFHGYLDIGNREKALGIFKKVKNPAVRAYFKGVVELLQGDYILAERYFNRADTFDKTLKYRLYCSLAHLYTLTGAQKMASKYQSKSQQLSKYLRGGYPLFMKSNFKGINTDELWGIAGRVFLLARHPDIRIL